MLYLMVRTAIHVGDVRSLTIGFGYINPCYHKPSWVLIVSLSASGVLLVANASGYTPAYKRLWV